MSTASSPSRYAELKVPPRGWRLPEAMREELNMPFGVLVSENELETRISGCHKLISVGDIVSATLVNKGLVPDITVYDGRTERKEIPETEDDLDRLDIPVIKVDNPAGYITPGLIDGIRACLSSGDKIKLKVKGEEDLAALVCAALAPERSCLLYGMPGKGVVLVRLDEETNNKAKKLIGSMEELN